MDKIDRSKLIKSTAETPIPVYFAIDIEVLEERMARTWEFREKKRKGYDYAYSRR